MKSLLTAFGALTIVISCINSSLSQVEVRSTSPNSVLAINSPNKAVLLPRINNTSLVNSPEEGLFVYNKATKSPSYHDGIQWNNMASMMMPTSDTDSLTYTILQGFGPPLGTGTFDLLAFNSAGVNPGGQLKFDQITLTKLNDARSIGFMTMFLSQTTSNNTSIEIKVYKTGQSTPYYSYKITNLFIFVISNGSVDGSAGSNASIESLSIQPRIIGFKDWSSNTSVAWDNVTQQMVAY